MSSHGQEKNFVVEDDTDCSSISGEFLSKQAALNEIELRRFRDSQHFKINRQKGVRSGNFYSCDHSTGFLKLMIDKDTLLYANVPKEIWENLIKSSDPDGFVSSMLTNKFLQIK